MHFRLFFCAVFTALSFVLPAIATTPPMPPDTNGSGNPTNNGMKHANVTLSGTVVSVDINTPPTSPVTMTSGFGVDYTPGKFDVLEDVYFNAQHGWLPNGFFITLPAGGSIWIKRTGVTQPMGSTFKVYEGGNAIEGMPAWSMNEIYLSDGDIWQWDGAMHHDYYTADLPGDYSMSFELYAGDSVGNAVIGYTADTATFEFTVIPEPTSIALILIGASGLFIRRR